MRVADVFRDPNRMGRRMVPPTPVTVMIPDRLVHRLTARARDRGRTLAFYCSELIEVSYAVAVGAIALPAAANAEAEARPREDLPRSIEPYGGRVAGTLAPLATVALVVRLPIAAPPEPPPEPREIAAALRRTVRALRSTGMTPKEVAAAIGLDRETVLQIHRADMLQKLGRRA